MLNALCASSFSTSDIVVLVVLVLGLIIGIASGFAKMLNGFVGTIVALVVSVILGYFLAGKLAEVGAFQDLTGTISTFLKGKFDVMALDGKVDGGKLLVLSGGDWVSISEQFSGAKGKIASLFEKFAVIVLAGDLATTPVLATCFAGFIVKVICGLIIFVGGLVVIMIIFSIISKALQNVIQKRKPIRNVDRVFGMILGIALTIVVLFFAMFIIAKLGDKAKVVIDDFNNSTLAKWFFDNNPFLML